MSEESTPYDGKPIDRIYEQGTLVVFSFKLMQSVYIRHLGVEGIVDGFLFDGCGTQIRVCYWYDGTRRQEFMYDSEVDPL